MSTVWTKLDESYLNDRGMDGVFIPISEGDHERLEIGLRKAMEEHEDPR